MSARSSSPAEPAACDPLIERLAQDLPPVRPLRAPMLRAGGYLLCAFMLLGTVVRISGFRHDLAARMAEPAYFGEWLASLITGLVAVLAAFHVSVPGRARLWAVLPALPLALWLAVIGGGCWQDWVRAGPEGVQIGESVHCLQVIVSLSLPLGALLLILTRHAAPVRPTLTAVWGGLGVAALSAAALSLFHPLNASIMVLIWHGMAIALVVLAGRVSGRALLRGFLTLDRRLRGEASFPAPPPSLT